MSTFTAFPNVEQALVALLADLGRCGTRTPADLADQLPFHRITCISGTDNVVTDVSRVDVDTFAATNGAAADAAEAVRQRLLSGPHVIGTVVLDRARTDTKPHEVPWTGTPPPYRYTAAYQISARR